MSFFKKAPTVKEQQRENDKILRRAGREIERDKLALEKEEKKIEQEIRKMAREGNNEGCKVLAKQLVMLRKQKARFYAANSKISGVSVQNKAMGANIAIAGAMGTTAKTMGDMNKLMNPHKIASNMAAFQKENAKMEMTDEMISDTLDDMLGDSDEEFETNGVISKVLDEIGIEVSGKMADAPSALKNKIGATSITDDEIEAQLAKLKS
ncbi:charged multivesicular body protein 2b [Arctopsyche grandis]|uniref:charged multivesicular body protein 2b n=1 Tax=Arctopsyche grandis TaxID=121162 RepID=UPI00406D6CF5